MSPRGTAAYEGLGGLPHLVAEAVSLARREGFGNSRLAPDLAALVATRRWPGR